VITAALSLEQALQASRLESSNGNHDAATRVLLEPIQDALSCRALSEIVRFHRRKKWPLPSVRLSRNEIDICVEPLTPHFTGGEADALRTYVVELCNQSPALYRERASKALEYICRRLATIRAPLRSQILVFNTLSRLRWLLLISLSSYRQDLSNISIGLGLILSEPQSRTKAILKNHEADTLLRYSLRIFHQISDAKRLEYLQSFRWPERLAYKRFISGSDQSRILVSIHMGDFLGAFSRIAQEASDDWQVLALRRETDASTDPLEHMQFGRTRAFNILRPGQYSPVQVAARLRKGRHTLAILCDLSTQFGETVVVSFLDRSANFVRGPASIALLAGCPIIPFVCYRDAEANHIHMGAVIHTKAGEAESFTEAVARVTQQLAGFCEQWVRQHPHQWKYLPEVFNYFQHDKSYANVGSVEHEQ
jgi:hypothetical protein